MKSALSKLIVKIAQLNSKNIVFIPLCQTPQSPLVRPVAHDELSVDNYALGTNAVVAVISYTVCEIRS